MYCTVFLYLDHRRRALGQEFGRKEGLVLYSFPIPGSQEEGSRAGVWQVGGACTVQFSYTWITGGGLSGRSLAGRRGLYCTVFLYLDHRRRALGQEFGR